MIVAAVPSSGTVATVSSPSASAAQSTTVHDGLRDPADKRSVNLAVGKLRYDTRCYFNVRSKADTNQLNLLHGNDN